MGARKIIRLLMGMAVLAIPVFAAQAQKTIWNGVYTADQAVRGEKEYANYCESCHGADLAGNADNPALAGKFFMQIWEAGTVDELFRKMKATMPPDRPAGLEDDEYVDILAYMLNVHGAPPGNDRLVSNQDRLGQIEIVPQDGPSPIRTGTLVRVYGCLHRDANVWTITAASEPVRVRNSQPSDPTDLKRAESLSLGRRTFRLLRLQGTPEPVAYLGHRVELKGLLFQSADGDRLNVTSVATIAASCEG